MTYMAAGPDPATLHAGGESSYFEYIALRPEAVFTSHPLFPAVAATRTYKNHVGDELVVHAYLSEE
jgi:hypothetical protein